MRTLVAVLILAGCIIALRGWWKQRRAERANRLDTAWDLFVHGNGRYLHFIPSGEEHTEDEEGECRCHPRRELRQEPDQPDRYVFYHSRRPR